MALFLYNIFLFLYKNGIRLFSLRNDKAKKWLDGRKNIFLRLEQSISKTDKIIWVHCASLGEFEQGRPVIEALRERYSTCKILLTFFSPSGYEIRKNYNKADFVFYLPLDSAANARRFLDTVHPELVVFVKYDYWYHYLQTIHKRNIPLLIISCIFRKEQPFFKWYGVLHRRMLHFFTALFVQDEPSQKLVSSLGIKNNIIIAGDTRFDRVISIAGHAEQIPGIAGFCGNDKVLVAGSTWPPDESVIAGAIKNIPGLKTIIAPHEISPAHMESLLKQFPGAVLFSKLADSSRVKEAGVLIIDNIGMLSKLYRYATITYVGGGFGSGIHNILEAVVYEKPVIFGPRYQKFREANELVAVQTAFSIRDINELKERTENLLMNKDDCYSTAVQYAGSYIARNKDATAKILAYIQEKRLLTN